MGSRYFSTAGYGAPGPYCAAFVRYVFRTALGETGEMPVVMADRYRAMGHPLHRLSRRRTIRRQRRTTDRSRHCRQPDAAGRSTVFIDTYSGYAQGTITHIGICVGGGLMATRVVAAVHVRNHALYFPDKLVECAAPIVSGPSRKEPSSLEHGQVQAMLRRESLSAGLCESCSTACCT